MSAHQAPSNLSTESLASAPDADVRRERQLDARADAGRAPRRIAPGRHLRPDVARLLREVGDAPFLAASDVAARGCVGRRRAGICWKPVEIEGRRRSATRAGEHHRRTERSALDALAASTMQWNRRCRRRQLLLAD